MKQRIIFLIASLLTLALQVSAGNKMTVKGFPVSAGEAKKLSIELENKVTYAAFRFDPYLPDGITIQAFEPGLSVLTGDANGDGEVNATDIVDIVNHTIGKQTSTGKFNDEAADANEDGTVNAADIVKIVNLIMDDHKRFDFSLSGLNTYYPFYENDSTYHFCINPKEDFSNLKLNSEHVIIINGVLGMKNVPVDLSDFTKPVHLDCLTSTGDTIHKVIYVYDLPVLMINTPYNIPIESKEYRVDSCILNLLLTDGSSQRIGTAGIKGRGNSTWRQEKKPYNIKLKDKIGFLGMKESKHWLLLSNPYYDRTQLHNDVAFEIARHTNYPWVQSGEYVELLLNGEHKGLYYLCEKIRVEKGRINIHDISEKDIYGDAITGGYILEANIVPKDSLCFTTDFFNRTGNNFEWPIYWEISTPDDNIPSVQVNYIKDAINKLENSIYLDSTLMSGDYLMYLDIESAINWWLVENLCLNEESSRTKNLILYKDRDLVGGGKFMIGPPWDLDAWTFGLKGNRIVYALETTWCYRQLFKSQLFISRLKEKWSEYRDKWGTTIPHYIEMRYKEIHRSALRNEQMWPSWHWVNYYGTKSYETLVEEMKQAFVDQLAYMDYYIDNL